MSEMTVNKQMLQATSTSRLRKVVQIAMLGAVSTVLMFFEFPLPFIAPPFYQLDFSEIPVLVGSFAMGPLAGVLIELLKNLLHVVLKGTTTAGVGEFANFLIGSAFIVPAGLFYKKCRSRKSAVTGMAAGTLLMAAIGCVINAFILLPMYAVAFGMPIDTFVAMGTQINSSIDSLFTFVILTVAPFNLFKGVVMSVITLLIYKKIRVLLRG